MYFELSKNQKTNELTKDVVIKIVKEQKPETASQLLNLVQERTNLPEKEILILLSQLEAEDKMRFSRKQECLSTSFRTYLFTSDSAWFWTVISVAMATAITVFAIPQNWIPLSYVRNILGVIFVMFLPGYAFIKAFFQNKVPIKTTSESFDTIERVVLSIGLSIALIPMIGLILYYTPFGLGLTPITLSLLAFTTVLATVAMAREYHLKSNVIQQTYWDSL